LDPLRRALFKVDGIIKDWSLSSPDEYISFSILYTIFLGGYLLGIYWTNRVMVDCIAHNEMDKRLLGGSK
jgi:hypothetical protein